MIENWKQISEWPYEVSDQGRVRNTRTGLILTPMRCGQKRKQYSTVLLCHVGSQKRIKVHTLVLSVFVGSRPPNLIGLHLDDNTANNSLSNLEWGTHVKNARMARDSHSSFKLGCGGYERVLDLSRMNARGRDIARWLGISEQRVCDIKNGRYAACDS